MPGQSCLWSWCLHHVGLTALRLMPKGSGRLASDAIRLGVHEFLWLPFVDHIFRVSWVRPSIDRGLLSRHWLWSFHQFFFYLMHWLIQYTILCVASLISSSIINDTKTELLSEVLIGIIRWVLSQLWLVVLFIDELEGWRLPVLAFLLIVQVVHRCLELLSLRDHGKPERVISLIGSYPVQG